MPLYLCHYRLWRNWGLWFSHRSSLTACLGSLVNAVPTRSSSHLLLRLLLLGLRLRLRLRRHANVGHATAFHGGASVLVGRWLRGIGRPGARRLPVGRGHIGVALRFLVAALGPSLDGGRLLQGEVGAVGLGLGAAGPSLQGGRGFVLLGGTGVSLRPVTLQTYTKYTLTENS